MQMWNARTRLPFSVCLSGSLRAVSRTSLFISNFQTKMPLNSPFHLPHSPKGAIIMSGEGSHTRILSSAMDHSFSC